MQNHFIFTSDSIDIDIFTYIHIIYIYRYTMFLYLYLGFCPRPVTVVKDLPFGSIHPSYQSCFGTVTVWGVFGGSSHCISIHSYLVLFILIHYFLLLNYMFFFHQPSATPPDFLSLGLAFVPLRVPPATETPAAILAPQRHSTSSYAITAPAAMPSQHEQRHQNQYQQQMHMSP